MVGDPWSLARPGKQADLACVCKWLRTFVAHLGAGGGIGSRGACRTARPLAFPSAPGCYSFLEAKAEELASLVELLPQCR